MKPYPQSEENTNLFLQMAWSEKKFSENFHFQNTALFN